MILKDTALQRSETNQGPFDLFWRFLCNEYWPRVYIGILSVLIQRSLRVWAVQKVKDEKEVNLYEPPRYYAISRNMQIYFDNILIRTRWVTSEVLITIRISEFFEAYTWIEQTKLDQPEDKCNRIWSNFRLIFEDWTKNENYLWSHFRIQRWVRYEIQWERHKLNLLLFAFNDLP